MNVEPGFSDKLGVIRQWMPRGLDDAFEGERPRVERAEAESAARDPRKRTARLSYGAVKERSALAVPLARIWRLRKPSAPRPIGGRRAYRATYGIVRSIVPLVRRRDVAMHGAAGELLASIGRRKLRTPRFWKDQI